MRKWVQRGAKTDDLAKMLSRQKMEAVVAENARKISYVEKSIPHSETDERTVGQNRKKTQKI